MSGPGVALLVALLLGVLIFVHELGHFLVAKLFGVKVLRFSLGFGPKAFGFTRGETEYRIAWFPLGGYVKMLGEGTGEEIGPGDEGRAFQHKPLWQRYLIALAGPVMNLILPACIYFLFFIMVAVERPPIMGNVLHDEPADGQLLPGDRIVAIDGEPIRYWDEFRRTVGDSAGKPLRFTIDRGGESLTRYITPRPAQVIDDFRLPKTVGQIGVTLYYYRPQVGIADPAGPAAQAGIRTFDRVTSIGGREIKSAIELEERLRAVGGAAVAVAYLRPRPTLGFADVRQYQPRAAVVYPARGEGPGKRRYDIGLASGEFYVYEVDPASPAAALGIEPGDRLTRFDGQPLRNREKIERDLTRRPKETHRIAWLDAAGREHERSFLPLERVEIDEYKQRQTEVVFGANPAMPYYFEPPVPVEGRFTYAATNAARRTTTAVVGLVRIFGGMAQGEVSRDAVGGPIAIMWTTAVAARKGWDSYLGVMAGVSLSLGLINLLPVPLLDGGHMLLFTMEAIRRRPLSPRTRDIAAYVGLALVVSLMIFALINDVGRYLLG
ncbi:MAG TPA: RIP metalloprotease RseP [Polyangia bacterium]